MPRNENKWCERFLDLCEFISHWSKDPSTKCAAVIVDEFNRVVSVGFNGFPRGVADTEERLNNREDKYRYVQHAETNALLFAQRDLHNCTLYVYPLPPCSQCAGRIIQAGIARVITVEPPPEAYERWGEDIEIAKEMFREAEVVYLEK